MWCMPRSSSVDPFRSGDSPELLRLTHEDIEAIVAAVVPIAARAVAERVLELIDERQAVEMLDAAGLARVLGVDREWVYSHADRLGAIRLGDGPRPRLRFEPLRSVELFRELSAQRRVVPIRGGSRAPPVPRPRRSQGGRR
jgi:hypothetical protein